MKITNVLPKDAIPSIDEPSFGSSYFGSNADEVVVVDGDPPRAYPIRILNFHEIVNDTVDGQQVAVTWCPLCGSAVVYDRRAGGRTLTFGVSGKLADDDLVMYDRETDSEWKQSLGECIEGPLAGETLTVLPAPIVPYETFEREHPGGLVLQRPDLPSEAASDDDEPAPVEYAEDPYREYFDSAGFGLGAHRGTGTDRSWDREDLDPKDVVLGIEHDGKAVGYPQPWLEAAGGVVTDTVGGKSVVVSATAAGLHAFEHPGWDLTREGESLRGDGTTWDPGTGASEDGRTLERVPTQRLFAFAWQDDHGHEAFFSRN